MRDVHWPSPLDAEEEKAYEAAVETYEERAAPEDPSEDVPELNPPHSLKKKFFILVFLALAAGVVGAFSLYALGKERAFALKKDVAVFEGAVGRISKAQNAFLPQERGISPPFKNGGDALEGFSVFLGALRGIPADAKIISENTVRLADEFDETSLAFPDVLGGKNDAFAGHLEEIRGTLGSLVAAGERLAHSGAPFASSAGMNTDAYLPFLVDANRAKKFLDAFVPWLRSEGPRHLLVLFYNPAELRPGGGFLGSYADVAIAKGKVTAIEVHDVHDVDSTMGELIVPPRELQGVVTRWRAADANWFFDFPTSARKTIELMEKSDYERTRGVKFDGAVAVSGYAVGDLLAQTGPVSVAASKTPLTKENVLTQIQDEVEKAQQSKKARPKKIVEQLTPALLARIASFSPDERHAFLASAAEWLEKKQIAVFFRDPALESFLDYYGFARGVMPLAKDFNGSYLAVADANPGSGKSDIYIGRKILLQAVIGADGIVTHHLTVAHAHRAPKAAPVWYRLPNATYLKIFVNPGARLTGAVGGAAKTVAPRVNYAKAGYAVDPDLAAVERNAAPHPFFPAVTAGEESGKQVFATWVTTLRGASSTVTFDYASRLAMPVAERMRYQFIFEKQMGAKGDYAFEISAPVGFRFKENKLPVFEYTSSDPPGRVALNLTLEAEK